MPSPRPHRTVLGGGSVFDVRSGASFDADLSMQDGRIIAVGSDLDGDRRVDVTGMTLLPGLIDCHVHVTLSETGFERLVDMPFSYRCLQAAANLRLTLEAGVTCVRDAAGADAGMRRALADGIATGPRLLISVTMLSQTGGHGDPWRPSGQDVESLFPRHHGAPSGVADGPDELRKAVRAIVRSGADVIKVAASGGVHGDGLPQSPHYTPLELEAIVAEAARAQLGVMAHAHAAPGAEQAVHAGVRSVEHGTDLNDRTIERMVDRGTWLVPTLSAPHAILSSLPPDSPAYRLTQEMTETHHDSLRRAYAAGVRIAMGTDAGISPHGRNLDELALMVAQGIAPDDCLRAATSSAAALLGLADEIGELVPGKVADVVAVAGDPLELDQLPQRIRAVYRGGQGPHDLGAPADRAPAPTGFGA